MEYQFEHFMSAQEEHDYQRSYEDVKNTPPSFVIHNETVTVRYWHPNVWEWMDERVPVSVIYDVIPEELVLSALAFLIGDDDPTPDVLCNCGNPVFHDLMCEDCYMEIVRANCIGASLPYDAITLDEMLPMDEIDNSRSYPCELVTNHELSDTFDF